MLFEQVLQRPGPLSISHVFVRDHLTFFKIDNESFCTGAGWVKHQTDPMFDGPVMRVRAKEVHDPQAEAKMKAQHEQLDYEDELWDRHGDDVLGALVLKAATLLVEKGVEACTEFLHAHLTIIPEEQAKLMAKKLEDEHL